MLVIDRFEGDYAVCECEDGEFVRIARKLIASGAKEGDTLDPWEGGFRTNEPKTREARSRIRRKVRQLFSDDAGGDQTT